MHMLCCNPCCSFPVCSANACLLLHYARSPDGNAMSRIHPALPL